MDDALLDSLRELDACAVSDAMDMLGQEGVADGIRCLTGRSKIAGRVVPVELGPRIDGEQHSQHLGTAAIEVASAGDVIVVAHGGRLDVAGWGGLLSVAAHARGLGGVIVDGASRDIDEATEVGFAIFAKCGTPRTARGRVVEKSFNQPITIDGIAVSPGDLVIADSSGVVFIPRSVAESVIATASKIAQRERAMAHDVDGGALPSVVMGRQYEEMVER